MQVFSHSSSIHPMKGSQAAPTALRLAVALAVLCAPSVWARGSGISGYSGMNGSTCTSCHGGGAAPSVSLTGPASLNAGQTGSYTLTITGGPAVLGGFDVASNNAAAVLAAGTGSKLLNGEVVHSTEKSFAGNSVSWTFTARAPSAAGTFRLYAAGLSADGSGTNGDGVGTASLPVTVASAPPANQAPSVSLTGPVSGATFTAPANITLTASASDADGSVARVEFFSGATKLGEDLTSPYSFSWANVAAGSYTLTARATDNSGATTTSAGVGITVAAAPPPANRAPTVSLTSPANGAAFTSPATIALAASAADADGSVARVEFFSGTTKLGEDLTSPYSLSWANVAAGSYTLTARATDNQGLSTTSAGVSVTVAAPPPPNQAPAVSLTGPVNGATFTAPANISLSAAASDVDGSVARVEFFSGGTKLGEDLTSPYSLSWANVAAGGYTLTARATDNQGSVTTSAAVSITVAGPTPNLPPGVSLTSPANGAAFTAPASITLAANASDADGTIARVEFFSGTTRLGEDLTSPYSLVWSNVPAGTYSLTARATDNQGASTTSVARQVAVSEPPVVDAGTPTKKPCNSRSKAKRCRDEEGALYIEPITLSDDGEEEEDDVAEASYSLTADTVAGPQAGCSATAASPVLLLSALGLGVALLRRRKSS